MIWIFSKLKKNVVKNRTLNANKKNHACVHLVFLNYYKNNLCEIL